MRRMMMVIKRTDPFVQAVANSGQHISQGALRRNLLVPAKASGTETTRTLLSGLPDSSKVEEGLKRRTVGGKSCAFNIDSKG